MTDGQRPPPGTPPRDQTIVAFAHSEGAPAERLDPDEITRLYHTFVRQEIVVAHKRCLAARQVMEGFAEPYRRRGPEAYAGLVHHAAFKALLHEFVEAMSHLTIAVDAADIPNPHPKLTAQLPPAATIPPCPWEDLILDARLMAALQHGIEASKRHVQQLALARFLATNEGPFTRQ